jgi:AcrR family transcriptional regulator
MEQARKIREPVQQRSKEKKARIIEAARKLIDEEGYEATNTNKIAAEARVSVGALYAYFNNKRDILLEVIRDFADTGLDDARDDMLETFATAPNLEEVLYILFRRHMETHARDKNLHREFSIQASKDEEIYRCYFAKDDEIDTLAKTALSQYVDRLRIEDIDAAVFLLRYVMDDVVHRLVFENRTDIEPDRILREMARMFYRYLVKE